MIHIEGRPFQPPAVAVHDLERDEIVRRTLEEVERRILSVDTNALYRQAWKVVIKILHSMKP